MDFDYDVVIVGGAFSGATTALMLKRNRPNSRVPEARVTKLLRKGLLRWWKAEITNLRLMFKSTARISTKQSPAASSVEA